MSQRLSTHLSNFETVLVQRFKQYTQLYGLATFTSDDFRMAGLDRFFVDRPHDLGELFRKLTLNNTITKVGRIPSILPKNNFREIKIYKWTEKR